MPNTYTELRRTVVGTATPTVTFDLTGISGYTDLVLVADNVGSSASVVDLGLRFNNDSSSLYSETDVYGAGSSALSSRSSRTFVKLSYSGGSDKPMLLANIMNYANTTTFKTVLIRDNTTTNAVRAAVSLWRNTAAITSMTILYSSGNIAAGATFSLYGIANADQGAAKATGGIITEDSQYWYHTFAASSAFIPKQSLTCDYIVVAGGGGGGGATGGGGGAGGFFSATGASFAATSYPITIGGGGAGGNYNNGSGGSRGVNGSNSSFNSITRSGGGGGGTSPSPNNLLPGSGGSGGGGSRSGQSQPGATGNAGSYSPVEGFAGGSNFTSSAFGSGGGGGAGAVGGTGTSTTDGVGGIGATSSLITDIVKATTIGQLSSGVGYIAGGGGASASASATGGAGGLGGGGAGGNSTTGLGTNGAAATGGGGGAEATSLTRNGANGGSGVVIIRYSK
jgi:hypothetical protein